MNTPLAFRTDRFRIPLKHAHYKRFMGLPALFNAMSSTFHNTLFKSQGPFRRSANIANPFRNFRLVLEGRSEKPQGLITLTTGPWDVTLPVSATSEPDHICLLNMGHMMFTAILVPLEGLPEDLAPLFLPAVLLANADATNRRLYPAMMKQLRVVLENFHLIIVANTKHGGGTFFRIATWEEFRADKTFQLMLLGLYRRFIR